MMTSINWNQRTLRLGNEDSLTIQTIGVRDGRQRGTVPPPPQMPIIICKNSGKNRAKFRQNSGIIRANIRATFLATPPPPPSSAGFGHGFCDSGKTCPKCMCPPPPPTEQVPYAYDSDQRNSYVCLFDSYVCLFDCNPMSGGFKINKLNWIELNCTDSRPPPPPKIKYNRIRISESISF